jgi:Flp pilus assembly pilin Flp
MLKRFAARLHRDTTGAMSVEKILILALVALPILILLTLFRAKIVNWFRGQSDQMDDPGTIAAP